MDAEEEVERREAALAATPLLRPSFSSTKVSQAQLDKFKELHNKRLKMKERSNDKRKHKGKKDENLGGPSYNKDKDNSINAKAGYPNVPSPKLSLTVLVEAQPPLKSMKRQKLYWGLDAKERWERKANM